MLNAENATSLIVMYLSIYLIYSLTSPSNNARPPACLSSYIHTPLIELGCGCREARKGGCSGGEGLVVVPVLDVGCWMLYGRVGSNQGHSKANGKVDKAM